ncbi:hypothetical protein LshimejAT787_0205410 [Lyophyllum shimeji]|uniref:C3H1-type domain-containing protein n=1 Tax=Lyophyllum shimeji TaxID=47721 RepID=A0A9P3UL29_LYOSH|nr:hypothetical protein LshimejAT787_0205410 [Lyophyllum shimeji]
MPGFKIYQCRYFHSDGRAKIPSCNQGKSCRFLHPGDADWPGLKPKPMERRIHSTTSSSTDKDRFLPKPDIFNSPPHRPAPRSAPLVSQDDLFLRRKLEEDEKIHEASHRRMSLGYSDDRDHHNRGRDNKRPKIARSRNDSRNSSKHYENVSYLGVKEPGNNDPPTHGHRKKLRVTSQIPRKRMGNPGGSPDSLTRIIRSSPLSEDRLRTSSNYPDASSSVVPLVIPAAATDSGGFPSGTETRFPARISPTEKRVQQVVELFRNLPRLSSQAAQDAEAQAKADKKLKAYTELSSTLAKVSTTASAAVMPALADVLLRHAQGKQRAEDNLKAISAVWVELFETFVAEISHVMDAKLDDALRKIREEAERTHRSAPLHISTPMLKRQRSDVFSEHTTNRTSNDSRDPFLYEKDTDMDPKPYSKREQKRRRLSSISPARESTTQSGAQTSMTLELNIQEILSQMKIKMDEQAQSLQKLTKENNELKASLDQRPSIASCISSSTPPTSQAPHPGH